MGSGLRLVELMSLRLGEDNGMVGLDNQNEYMSIFNENFGSLMPSLSLTLNVEPPGPDLTLRCSII